MDIARDAKMDNDRLAERGYDGNLAGSVSCILWDEYEDLHSCNIHMHCTAEYEVRFLVPNTGKMPRAGKR